MTNRDNIKRLVENMIGSLADLQSISTRREQQAEDLATLVTPHGRGALRAHPLAVA